jgi:hypothetical protein
MLRITMAGLLCIAMAVSASSQTTSSAAPVGAAATEANVLGVRTVLYLRTDVSSSGTKPGKEVKAELAQAVTLPGGLLLPKGTLFKGTVLDVSKHSKEKPNGSILLEFSRAFPKGKDPVSVVVQIEKLAPEEQTGSNPLPNANGGMVSMAANSGAGVIPSKVPRGRERSTRRIQGSLVLS